MLRADDCHLYVSLYLSLADDPKYELTPRGLTVYGVEYDDEGIYECEGTEHTQGETITRQITVDVVSKFYICCTQLQF